jgi:hypothetical protein
MKIQITSNRLATILNQSRSLCELGFRRVGNVEIMWRVNEPRDAKASRPFYLQTLETPGVAKPRPIVQ